MRRALAAASALVALALATACESQGDQRPGAASPPPTEPSTTVTTALATEIRRFVSPDGNDRGAGTSDAPWRTLTHALEELTPGETLVVGHGVYRERIRDVDITAGTRDAPIRVIAAPDARPVVEGLLWLEGADHWHFDGINVTWGRENRKSEHMVKFTDGDEWSFENAEVWGARSYAAILVVGNPRDFRLAGLYVHDTHRSNGRNEDHLIYLNSGTAGGVVERNVLANSPNGRAIKIGPGDDDGPAVENLVIRYNTMYRNFGPSNVQLAWGSSRNQVYRNILVDPEENRANVTVFELAGDGNVVRDNLGWGGVEVVERVRGIESDGNVELDPDFADPEEGDFEPQNPRARAYGRHAPAT